MREMIKLPTMGMLPALATAVTLGSWLFQGHDWIDNRLEHMLTASSSFIGAKLTEIWLSAVVVPDLT